MQLVLFIGGIVASGLLVYGISHLFLKRHASEETRELAGSVLFRIASLHGLVLALVFAQDLAGIRDVSVSAAKEATIVSDIYYDAVRYEGPETTMLQTALARYAVIVADEDWASLGEGGQLSAQAWEQWEVAYKLLLDATPQSMRQERLLDQMLENVREVSALRDARENAAVGADLTLFVWAALTGVVLISASYFTWPFTLLNLGMITGFIAYIGLILYIIIAFANPFASPGQASIAGFERFLTPEVRAMADGP